tara:strand:+ start:410 stop:634 length:225 start_codon:yes stop_codon:yes gene_type:complete
MLFEGKLKVGDLVQVRELDSDPAFSAQKLGVGLVVEVETDLTQPRRYPIIQVRFLKTEEVMRFIEKDLLIINEA